MATQAVIHLDNLEKNIAAARKKIGAGVKICLPVKADAYGHGVIPVSNCALEAGVEYLAVAGVLEGSEIRRGGINAPILLLSQILPEELDEVIHEKFIPLVSDEEFIGEAESRAQRADKKLTVHLKIDTGMGRLGCFPEDAVSLAKKITSSKHLCLGGIATHFPSSDSGEEKDIAFTKEQIKVFRETADRIKKAGIDPGIVHAANTGALVHHADSYFDMIRPGLYLYGYSPLAGEETLPIMELKSVLVSIKKIKKGEPVSYGRIWLAPEDTYIGVIPTGYADGFPRGLSNNHSIKIRGKAYPLAGRICMDQCMIDLGKEPEAERWDEAVIFGPGFINADDMAKKINTIPYEITCNINKRVPRVYVQEVQT